MAALLLLCCPGISTLYAETLTFKQVLKDGLAGAFESRIIREEIQAAQAGVEEARADLYPQLALQFGNEYVHVFHESDDIVSVGDAIITDDASGYKNSLIATAQYTLYDFGIRDLSIELSRKEVHVTELRESGARIEVQKRLLDLYTRGLKTQESIRAMEEISHTHQSIYRMSKRLHQAGTMGRDTLGDHALDMAEAFSQLEDHKTTFHRLMEQISYYTRQFYTPETIVLANLPQIPHSGDPPNLSQNPEIAIYDLEIAKKRTELSLLRRSKLPKVIVYGDWRLFGSNERSYIDSVSELESRDTSLTFYVEYQIFDGFRNRARQTRILHEIDALQLEKKKKKAALEQEYAITLNAYLKTAALEDARQNQMAKINEQKTNKHRLSELHQNNEIAIHKQMIELSRQRLDIRLKQIDQFSSAMHIKLMKEAGS